ncbi:alpha/beta fold hydrolase [Kineococcus aurantiacus]|uniref:Pimeloyl-ACP methyl ester carboxylesterase n=1 Tax=Kineococcus aurantiacus TaxID=37633 RepID=A0A7Y9J1M7_9ACTN|nr:alpha/beta hydrolase [Kineococcus aurantiacus]NYD23316.1 pimeloyl-ACP methyl ester carboxylesterase [Kineococcus aurantiacus]
MATTSPTSSPDPSPTAATIPGVEHHHVAIDDTTLHHVTAGTTGSPILLVHGFPETWWAFHALLPLLATRHRVIAVDLRGFGDSAPAAAEHSSSTAADDLHQLIGHLGLGPVHLLGQDLAGAAVTRLVATHPEEVLSLTAVEMALPGFGLEALADVTHGGSWHLGALAAPGIAEFILTGRERAFLADLWFPHMTTVAGAVTDADLEEFTRTYTRPDAWAGARGLYSSALREGDDLRSLLTATPLEPPVLAVDAMSAPFTAETMSAVARGPVTSTVIDHAGHHVALEAPQALAEAVLRFTAAVDAAR